jgi:hypothetical protein
LIPGNPCIGCPLNGVDTPVGRGADAGEIYEVPMWCDLNSIEVGD